MNATNRLLDRIAARLGISSDYAIAKALRAPTQRIYSYRSGRTQMDDDAAVEAAILAGDDPAAVLAEIRGERAKSPATREAWQRVAKLARAAVSPAKAACAVLALVAALAVTGITSPDAALAAFLSAALLYIIYIVH